MNQKTFSISVDCEDLREQGADDYNLYECKTRRSQSGIPRLLDIFAEQGVKATFFVDVDNVQKRISEADLKAVVRSIAAEGHEIGLHPHPPRKQRQGQNRNHLFDSPVGYLANYSREEQYRILECGKKTLEDWSGVKVTSHRGGSYSVTGETFAALLELGFRTDASIFWPAADYDFIPEDQLNLLNPFSYRGIIEVPVTCFYASFLIARMIKKTDINWSIYQEILAVQNLIGCNLDIFLHSYSIFDQRRKETNKFFEKNLNSTISKILKKRKNITHNKMKAVDNFQEIPEINSFSSLLSYESLKNIYFPKLNIKSLRKHLFNFK